MSMPLSSPLPLLAPASATSLKGTSAIPRLVYGTAWKKDRTPSLVSTALAAGFRGIDTAAQAKHYREDLVGAGLRDFLRSHPVQRAELYIQTKYSPSQRHDPSLTPLPYDPSDSLEDQVSSSVATSLRNLTPFDVSPASPPSQEQQDDLYLDALVLHSPLASDEQTLRAWRAMESHVPHPVRRLGISNVTLPELEFLWEHAQVKPAVVQNRFYPRDEGAGPYAQDVRRFCEERGVVFQSFWTLTGNPGLVSSAVVRGVRDEVNEWARGGSAAGNRAEVSSEVVVYALVMALGRTCVLDGTTDEGRMRGDLEGIKVVEEWAGSEGAKAWAETLESLRRAVDA